MQHFPIRNHGYFIQPEGFSRSGSARQLYPCRRQTRHFYRDGQQTRQPSGKPYRCQTIAAQQPQSVSDGSRGGIPPRMRLCAGNAGNRCRTRSRRDGKTAGAAAGYDADVVCQPSCLRLASRILPPLPGRIARFDSGQPQNRSGGRRGGFGLTRQQRRPAAHADCPPIKRNRFLFDWRNGVSAKARHTRHTAGNSYPQFRPSKLCQYGAYQTLTRRRAF